MTKMASIPLLLVLLVFSCSDKNALMTSGSQTDLAGSNEDICTFKTQDGDGAVRTYYLKPVRWDGKSKVEPGVLYRFESEAEFVRACPRAKEAIAQSKLQEKNKSSEISNLSDNGCGCIDYWANCGIDYAPNEATAFASGWNSSWDRQVCPNSVYHYLWIKRNSSWVDVFFTGYDDGSAHSNSMSYTYYCPGIGFLETHAAVIQNDQHTVIKDASGGGHCN